MQEQKEGEKEKMIARKETFQDRIMELYRQSGTSSVKEFASECGLARQTVAFYMTGERKLPDGASLLKICNQFSVSASWLLAQTDIQTIDPDISGACHTLGITEATAEKISGLDDQHRAALCRLLETPGFMENVLHDYLNYEVALACIHPESEESDEMRDTDPELKDGKLTLSPGDSALFFANKTTNRLNGLMEAQISNELVTAGYDPSDL